MKILERSINLRQRMVMYLNQLLQWQLRFYQWIFLLKQLLFLFISQTVLTANHFKLLLQTTGRKQKTKPTADDIPHIFCFGLVGISEYLPVQKYLTLFQNRLRRVLKIGHDKVACVYFYSTFLDCYCSSNLIISFDSQIVNAATMQFGAWSERIFRTSLAGSKNCLPGREGAVLRATLRCTKATRFVLQKNSSDHRGVEVTWQNDFCSVQLREKAPFSVWISQI